MKLKSVFIIRTAVAAAIAASGHATAASSQAQIPVRTLSAPDAVSTDHFGTILNVRPIAGGNVLVNDGARRQLLMLNTTLSGKVVVIDSVAVGGQSYGPRATPILPFVADSSLFVDGASLSLIVISPTGAVSRVISAPKPSDLRMLSGSAGGIDANGNLVYRGAEPGKASSNSNDRAAVLRAALTPSDSTPIVRANFETRTVDTLIRLKASDDQRVAVTTRDGVIDSKVFLNPITTFDEWAVLSDGSVAVVRAHDYHVDVLRADGRVVSGPKLPFDWRRLTDGDKLALIDSLRASRTSMLNALKAGRGQTSVSSPSGEVMFAVKKNSDGAPPPATEPRAGGITFDYMTPAEIVDYYPPVRAGAAKADMDGNVWILPTTSQQSRNGELVYDVVNNRGEMQERVRIPAGRAVAGFGRNGTVYLMYKDGTNGWLLERTSVVK